MTVSAEIQTDPAVHKAGAEDLQAPKAAPAYDRIDSWLLLAFSGHPAMTLPEFSKKRVPTRVFEMRDYESHSELKALAKIAMFNGGEIVIMRDLACRLSSSGRLSQAPIRRTCGTSRQVRISPHISMRGTRSDPIRGG